MKGVGERKRRTGNERERTQNRAKEATERSAEIYSDLWTTNLHSKGRWDGIQRGGHVNIVPQMLVSFLLRDDVRQKGLLKFEKLVGAQRSSDQRLEGHLVEGYVAVKQVHLLDVR